MIGEFFDKDYFDGKTSNYDRYTYESNEEFFNDEYKAAIKFCSVGKVLDVGCAFGFFLKICESHGWKTFGIDISKFALDNAKKFTNAELKMVDVSKQKLPYPDSFFDLVTSFFVFEHIKNPKNVIDEVLRVLKPGGILLLTAPIGEQKRDRDPTHVNICKNIDELKGMLNGFHVVKVQCTGSGIPGMGKLGMRRMSKKISYFLANFIPAFRRSSVRVICKKPVRGNICFFTTNYAAVTSGQRMFIKSLSEACAKEGRKCFIFTQIVGNQPKSEVIDGIEVFRRSINILDPMFYIEFAKLLRRNKISVIHQIEPLFSFSIASNIVKVFAGCKSMMSCLGIGVVKSSRITKFMISLLFDRLIAINNFAKLKLEFGKIVVIDNGVDLGKFKYMKMKRDNTILVVTRLHPIKSLETLIEAFPKILKKFPNSDIKIVGEYELKPQYYQKLVSMTKDMRLEKRVKFYGDVEQTRLATFYNKARVFVLPSLYELFPGVFLEAMACGLPIITTNVTGMPESIGDAGVMIKPENPDELADKIIELFSDKKMYKMLQKRGLERAKIFDIKNMINKYMSFYSELEGQK